MDLPGVQRHPQPDLLRARMRVVVRVQRRHQRGRQRFRQQALGHLGRNQDEYPVPAILVTAVIPRDTCAAERLPHRTVQPVSDRHLIAIGSALIPEPLHVNDNDGPVNGQPLVLHLPSPRQERQKRSSHWPPSLTPGNAISRV